MIDNPTFRALSKILRIASSSLSAAALSIDAHPLIPAWQKKLLGENIRFRDQHKGKRAFVLGNGPSLNHHRLENLENEIVFTLNGFACHPILSKWQPVALTLADQLYIQKIDSYLAEFEQMRNRLTNCDFFVPVEFYDTIMQHKLLPIQRCFFTRFYSNLAHYDNFTVDLCHPLPGVQTVSLFAIMISLYMGCNPIYLIGMDCDFLAHPKQQTHFSNAYESLGKSSKNDKDHMSNWSYLHLMTNISKMFAGYKTINLVAKNRGQSIINASEGGYLDVFPRVSFDSLF